MSLPAREPVSDPGPQRPWVILGSIPLVSKADNFLPGTDVFVGFADPPRVSIASMPRRIAPDAHANIDNNNNYPYIVAVNDSTGRFLLHATQGLSHEPAVVERHDHIKLVHRGHAPAYFLCNAHTGAASRLPDPVGNPVLFPGNVGLIADPTTRADGGPHYVVAELQPMAGTAHATLLCYSTASGRWAEKEVLGYSPDHPPWGRDGVISFAGRLWWVDLSYGLLTCDPFARAPSLRHVPLPRGSVMAVAPRAGALDRQRCVRVSAGKLRYVQLHGILPETQMVTMWTLDHQDDGESTTTNAAWKREYQATLSEIWADGSYKATGMPKRAPVLAAVNPQNPRVVYFFLDAWIFAVDVPARRVLECDVCQMVDPPVELFSSRFVHAWELPPSLCPDNAASSTD
ncbi:uncharacterized protein LOC100826642 [Brachypodium distachyon]|nr:uncharacterized protein LOC100826642 [Brachypodium distachyon]|eukprot:XP_003565760.1 uncharacterized protein LOC100826642 [Brachypodium distachyon]